jgi:polyprenyl-phospho-N-acetylgalactosaminyl synthase
MSLLQFFIIIIAIIFFLFGIDLYKRKKMNILHFFVFVFGSGAIILFAINNELLNSFWRFFGLTRWADLIVYWSLVVLAYFYITLLNSHTKDKHELTRLITHLSIDKTYELEKEKIKNYKNKTEKDDFVFNIRVYNEWNVVWEVIDEIVKAWFKKLVFINDWSRDNSLQVLNEKKKQYPDCLFIILSHTINRWWWAANQTWYKFIQKYAEQLQVKRFVWFDSDGQMDIKDMDIFMSEIKKNNLRFDAYLGSRFIQWWKAENIPFFRKIILAISRFVTIIFYNAKMSDPHNWYRVISINSFKKIKIMADGMHYANEVNEQIKKHKIKYKEVPVHIRYTKHSLQKWQKNSNSIKLAVEMIYKKIFFR